MRIALLTRRTSAFQIYAANYLWNRGICELVIFEQGQSYAGEHAFLNLLDIVKKLSKGIVMLLRRPGAAFNYVHKYINHKKYFGFQETHNKRLLKTGYRQLEEGVSFKEVDDINSRETLDILIDLDPDIVFVFGTSLIRPHIFESIRGVFINLHWGWSPKYRGEGIVTALEREGKDALGVTVHLLSEGIDSGDILYRSRPTLDDQDNFYSIGLKLTLLGVELFEKIVATSGKSMNLNGVKQDLSQGTFRGSKYMQKFPEVYRLAWKRLHSKS